MRARLRKLAPQRLRWGRHWGPPVVRGGRYCIAAEDHLDGAAPDDAVARANGSNTSGTATFQIYGASDADGGAAAIVGAALVASTGGGGGEIELPVGLINPLKPYISVVCTTANGTGICGAALHQADPFMTAA